MGIAQKGQSHGSGAFYAQLATTAVCDGFQVLASEILIKSVFDLLCRQIAVLF